MELVLGIDLGTSYFKFGVFDRSGELRGLTRIAVETNNGDGLLCELPTQRFWAPTPIEKMSTDVGSPNIKS